MKSKGDRTEILTQCAETWTNGTEALNIYWRFWIYWEPRVQTMFMERKIKSASKLKHSRKDMVIRVHEEDKSSIVEIHCSRDTNVVRKLQQQWKIFWLFMSYLQNQCPT